MNQFKFKTYRSKHFDDHNMEKIRKQVYESLKFYFDTAFEYVKEHYELKIGDQAVEDYD